MEGTSYAPPPPPPLPSYRVEEVPPFTFTGVDFAGPLMVRIEKAAACTSKTWICLYTCCTTRAVHLEAVLDMTTQSFIRSFKRFTSRRGLPRRIVSDNGKTFKGADKVIQSIMRHPDVQQHFSGRRVKWTFNVKRAPWWGGLFERLIQSTKRCLRKVAGKARLTYEELLTILCEVEAVINSRPLTYVTQGDFEEPLTPSHLMMGRRLISLPDSLLPHDVEDDDYEQSPETLAKRMKFLHSLLDRFWYRWKVEYLTELCNQHSLHTRKDTGTQVTTGDVVVIHSDGEKRGFWKLGVIEELITGRDGLVRAVRTSSPGGSSVIWQRPIQCLFPLEINSKEANSEAIVNKLMSEPGNILPTDCSTSTTSRPRRDAAYKACDRILTQVLQGEL